MENLYPGRQILMGIFALYVVGVSLGRIMSDEEFPRLTAMKRVWGRSRGLVMHFLSNVGVPLICGVIFLTRGIADFAPSSPPRIEELPSSAPFLQVAKARAPEPPLSPAGLSDPGPARLLP